jgi:hypothetical protein
LGQGKPNALTSSAAPKAKRPKKSKKDGKDKKADQLAVNPKKGADDLFSRITRLTQSISSVLGPISQALSLHGLLVVLLAAVLIQLIRLDKTVRNLPPGGTSQLMGGGRLSSQQYENVWLQERDGLWKWLDSRVGSIPDGLHEPYHEYLASTQAKSSYIEQREISEIVRVEEMKLARLRSMLADVDERR